MNDARDRRLHSGADFLPVLTVPIIYSLTLPIALLDA